METKDYLYFIVHDIHTTVVATVDDAGLPVTCAIDMMDSDGDSLYFLTAKGKSFYERLKKKGYFSLTGMKGKDTMSCTAVSVCGKVRKMLWGYSRKINICMRYIPINLPAVPSVCFKSMRDAVNGLISLKANRAHRFQLWQR